MSMFILTHSVKADSGRSRNGLSYGAEALAILVTRGPVGSTICGPVGVTFTGMFHCGDVGRVASPVVPVRVQAPRPPGRHRMGAWSNSTEMYAVASKVAPSKREPLRLVTRAILGVTPAFPRKKGPRNVVCAK